MSVGLYGFGAFAGAAEETTWGTAVASSTHWSGFQSSTLGQKRTIERVPDLQAYKASPAGTLGRDVAALGIEVGGDMVFVPRYDSDFLGLILEHVFGAVATTGAGPYAHVFTIDHDGVVGLTLQQLRGQHGSIPLAEVFEGCVINTFELSVSANAVVTMKLGVIGEASGGPVSVTGSATFPVTEEILAHHFASLSWASGTHRCKEWSILYDRKLVRRPYVASQYTDQPAPGAMAELTIKAKVEESDDALYDAYIAGTSGTLTTTATGTGNNALQVSCHNSRIVDLQRPVDTAGVLTYDVTWMASASAALNGFVAALTNDNASHK